MRISSLVGKQGGELKINQAEPPVRKAVGDIAHVGIVVAHAERLQFSEQLFGSFFVQMFHAAAAVGGDDTQTIRVGLQQAEAAP